MFEDEEYDDEFEDESYVPERKCFPACNLITFKPIVSDEELEYFARRRAAIPKRFFPESFVYKRLPVEK